MGLRAPKFSSLPMTAKMTANFAHAGAQSQRLWTENCCVLIRLKHDKSVPLDACQRFG